MSQKPPKLKQIGTYHVKVGSSPYNKKLADGSTEKYSYGRLVIAAANLTDKIGDKVMVRVFEEPKPKKAKP